MVILVTNTTAPQPFGILAHQIKPGDTVILDDGAFSCGGTLPAVGPAGEILLIVALVAHVALVVAADATIRIA